jgi:cobalamin biosynthesis protein CbiD
MDIRTKLIKASIAHFESHIEKHKINIEVMLANPMAIHDHTDLMDAIEKEVAQISEYMDKLEVMEIYFKE